MIKLSVEVRSGTARFDVAVQAESIQRALGLVAGRYPSRTCRVKFPIEAEDFFARDPAAQVEMVEPRQSMAA